MKLTPEKLAEHYDRLRQTVAFRDLKFPPRERMIFKITRDKKKRGYFRPLSSGWVIAISEEHNKTEGEVQRVMAHEMVHAHLEMVCPDAPHHGKEFQESADEVCRYFSFDREEF